MLLKNKIAPLVFMFLFTFSFSQCICEDNTSFNTFSADLISVSNNTVYIQGYKLYDKAGISDNILWTNGVLTNLTAMDAYKHAQITAIFVDNDNLYFAGSYYADNSYDKPCYWKNHIRYDLPNATPNNTKNEYSVARDIKIYNNDIYIAGRSDSCACYWKNGEITLLPIASEATGITVSDDTMYITGYNYDTYKIYYWINGSIHELHNTWSVNDIAVINNSVYVAGITFDSKPALWINGALTELSSTRSFGKTLLFNYQDTLYTLYNCLDYAAYIIANNTTYSLEPPEKHRFVATDVHVYNNDIYVAGELFDKDANSQPVYWLNGEMIYLNRE